MLQDDETSPLPPVVEDFAAAAHLENDGAFLLLCTLNKEVCDAGTEVTAHLHTLGNQKETIKLVLEDIGFGIVCGKITIPADKAKTTENITFELPVPAKHRHPLSWKESALTLSRPHEHAKIVKGFCSLERFSLS